jgi:rhodanese-related sulfurtransferase
VVLKDRRRRVLVGLMGGGLLLGAAAFGNWERAFVLGWPDPANSATTLADIETVVARRVPVPEVTVVTLPELLSRQDTLVLDVREAAEYEQSRIPGARRVDPGISPEEFRSRYGDDIRGKSLVLYCSVGVRSGYLLSRLQPVLAESGVAAAYNLRGGIFRWFGAGGEIVADTGPVNTVHPYDDHWGQLLVRTLASPSRAGNS